MNRSAIVVAIVCVVSSIFAPPVGATQVLYRTPQQLGQESQLVVTGKVVGVRSYWNDKRTKIFTETTVDVDETFKGTDVRTVRVTQLGGIVGNVKVTVAGALHWLPGEEVLLFLEPYAGGTYQVSGFSQGKYNIERDPVSGLIYVIGAAVEEGGELVGAPEGEVFERRSRVGRIPLERFVDEALGRKGGSE